MLRQSCWIIASVVIAIALVPCIAFGQITTATVTGTVKDGQGSVVPGATVALISDTRGTRAADTTTDTAGHFVFPNTAPDTYSVQVSLQGFKTLKVSGFIVSPGDRLALPAFTIDVGSLEETVVVTGESPLVQTASGERSFSIPTTSVANLPILSRNFRDLALLTPGVIGGANAGVQRIGGGGYANIQMDGISAMDTGNNGQMISMNVDAVEEVKVLVNSYQAEYGRSSGIQVLSVTKSGTNNLRGSVYDIERHSRWGKNSKANILNGVPLAVSDQRDYGFSIGGPIGKPGGNNKLFFFYNMQFMPRTSANQEQLFRVPTALERKGDFSQSRDNLGNLYPYVKDYTKGLPCSAKDTSGCFSYNGVLGVIPPDRLYGPGMALLNMYPVDANYPQTAGINYNTKTYSPPIDTLQYQPAARVDYQVTHAMRVSFRWNAHNQNSGTRDQYGSGAGQAGGVLPDGRAIDGLYNSKGNQKPWIQTMSASVNYNLGSRTYFEGIWGRTQNYYATVYTSKLSNRFDAGLGGIPDIYSTNRDVNPAYFMASMLGQIEAPFYVDGKIQLPQQTNWGTRSGNTPNTPQYPGWFNTNVTWDLAGSVTHLRGRHTIKAGVGLNHSWKPQNMTQGVAPMGTINFGEDTNNPYDTSYGYANAATGVFSTYSQASKFIESGIKYIGIEPYIQDNWKVSSRFTLDYGIRFVHLQPEHDTYGQASNFFPDQWTAANAPALYVPGCPGNIYPCSSSQRQAKNPLTGQLLGTGTAGLIGQRIPGTGSQTNGIKQQGQGISEYNFTYPFLQYAPRVGVAYQLRPEKVVLRGGFGLFYDRVEGNYTMSQSANPPTAESTTLYYAQLQNMRQGPASGGVPQLTIYRYDNANLPTTATWNAGVQLELPWHFALDVSYVGQHSYHTQGAQGGQQVTNLNMVDLGRAYLPQYQDPTLTPTKVGTTPTVVPGSAALTTTLLRTYQGYNAINQFAANFYRTSHGLQVSVQRRFSRGFSAGLNWNWTPYDRGNYSSDYSVTQRMEHRPDGTVGLRADQAQWEDLMKDQGTAVHIFKGNAVWNIPGPSGGSKIVHELLNDWQISGVWTAQTGGGYSIGYGYQAGGNSVNLTGSPDYGSRVRIIGDPGSGCSSNQYQQFNTAAFAGPTYGSNGMESGRNYMHGCFTSIWDLSLARFVRVGGNRRLELRAEVYNFLNTATVTGRWTTMTLNNPVDQVLQNNQYKADGTLNQTRLKPNSNSFGAATGWTSPLSMQAQVRFSF